MRRITGHEFLPALAGLSMTVLPGALAAADFSQSWRGASGAPCEGIGIHGAFSVHVNGRLDTKSDGTKVITMLQVYATSGAFTQNEGSASATALIKAGSQVKERVSLVRPEGAAVEAAPKSDETRRVYLPRNRSLTILKGSELWVQASAIVTTSQGACALGGTEQKISLP